jgi:phage gp45-like|tara:strand:- start:13001 stop:13471 length:471 start_codon:yes stop_codon:yes gene_type:complete
MATLTTNKNFLSPVGFQFKISSTEYPNLEYFAVGATLPGLSITAAEQSYRGVNLAFTGDRLAFDDLTLRINVTEDLDNYIETFNWLHNLAQTNNAEDLKVDATLLILTSHNNVNKEIKFKGVFPTSMTPIEFDAQAESIDYVQMDITFAYTNFEFV